MMTTISKLPLLFASDFLADIISRWKLSTSPVPQPFYHCRIGLSTSPFSTFTMDGLTDEAIDPTFPGYDFSPALDYHGPYRLPDGTAMGEFDSFPFTMDDSAPPVVTNAVGLYLLSGAYAKVVAACNFPSPIPFINTWDGITTLIRVFIGSTAFGGSVYVLRPAA